MKNLKIKIFSAFIGLFCLDFSLGAQTHDSTQAHQKSVSAISYLPSDGTVLSSGADGFLIKWNSDGIGEHYQVSDLPVRMVARSPNGTDIAVYESDGASLNRVSIWNWKTLTRKAAFRFSDTITSLAYSSKGTYIICGTASVNGTYFINAATQNIEKNKLKEGTGVVNYIYTSPTENSLLAYSPSGSLIYYNLRAGTKKQKFSTESNLSQVMLFKNGVFLAGYKDRSVYIIQAVTGKTVASYPASNPVLVSSLNSDNLYYILNDGRQFKLYAIQNDRNKAVIAPELYRTFSGLKSNERIICAEYADEYIYAGTNLGNIYKFDFAKSERVDTQQAITDNMYDKILDIDAYSGGTDFYFLTDAALYQSSYDLGVAERKMAAQGYTNLISLGSKAVLWSKDTRKTVALADVATGKITNLFTPAGNIQSLRLYSNNILIDVESNSVVNLYSFDKGTLRQIYRGSSIQDAVLYSELDLFVAKSSESSPAVPLVHVNTQTQELVPLTLKGSVAYSLNFDTLNNGTELYGVLITNDAATKKNTKSIFAYDVAKKVSRTCLSISDEDSNAFTYLGDKVLYTNIGKTSVRSYNLSTRRDFSYRRSASMPVKVVKNGGRLAVLNSDGSISWYNSDVNSVLANWYLTVDGQWFEF